MPGGTRTMVAAVALSLAMACGGTDAPPADGGMADQAGGPAAGLDPALAELVGMRGSTADHNMSEMGWVSVGGHAVNDTTVMTFWRSADGATCISDQVSDGRVIAVAPAAMAECDAAQRATRVVAEADDGGYRTVCGVFVDGKPIRYVCSVVGGDQHSTPTTLRTPDTEMTFHWVGGNKVRIEMQGVVPIEGTWSESEGEVDIITADRTWFYIADRNAAAMEVKSFDGGAP